jgi:hypothetical protein
MEALVDPSKIFELEKFVLEGFDLSEDLYLSGDFFKQFVDYGCLNLIKDFLRFILVSIKLKLAL